MSSSANLPVIDLRNPDVDELRRITHEVGFFYLTGTGVPDGQPARILSLAREFFGLPDEAKQEVENVNSPHFRGWTRFGTEQTYGSKDLREQLDLGPEGEVIDPPVHPWDVLEGPNQWPSAVPGLKREVLDYLDRLTGVSLRLLSAWARSLGQDGDVFEPVHGSPQPLLKIARYPGADSGQGVGPHKDIGVVTLLHLEPGSTGLQVDVGQGWQDVEPVEGALVVNIGEALEVATDGYLKATPHRVLPPEPGTVRYSLPYFYNPPYADEVPHLALAPDLAAQAPGAGSDLADAPLYAVSGLNSLKTRLRSHPNVAERHHAELLAADLDAL